MTRAELLTLFEEIVAILETDSSPVEKLSRIEELMFEPKDSGGGDDADLEEEDE